MAGIQFPNSIWVHLFGTHREERLFSLMPADNGKLVAAGWTQGNFGTQSVSGVNIWDAFVLTVSPDGKYESSMLIGSSSNVFGNSSIKDKNGSIYLAGTTQGKVNGQDGFGGDHDAFIAKYSGDGSHAWTQYIGSPYIEYGNAINVDADQNAYLTGFAYGPSGYNKKYSENAFVSKFNPDGDKLWTSYFGSDGNDNAQALATGKDGSVYVAGRTDDEFGGDPNNGSYDAFLTKINSTGQIQWTRLSGSNAFDSAEALAIDNDSNIYVAGASQGGISGSGAGGFISKYNAQGDNLWTRAIQKYGGVLNDIKVDSDGTIVFTGIGEEHGRTDGKNGRIGFAGRYSASGDLIEYAQSSIGNSAFDSIVVSNDALYIGGVTDENAGSEIVNGSFDMFVMKLDHLTPFRINNIPTGSLELSGIFKAGQTITISKGSVEDSDNMLNYEPSLEYSFEASNDNGITWLKLSSTDATDNNSTYTLTTSEVGKQIRGLLTYIDGYGTRESIASIASEAVKHGIWSEEPPDNIGLSTLASSFDSLPSWIEPGTFAQSNVYSISGGKLTPSENNDWGNNTLSITRKVGVDTGVYLSVSFDLTYDSSLLSPFNIHQDTKPYMIIPALVGNSNNYAMGGIESVLENSKGSSNTYDFNAWTYGGVLSNFNNAPLKSERSPIVFQANDLIKIDYKLGMTDTGLSYIWQSAKSTISGEVGQAYYEFFDPSYKPGQNLKVDLSFARQAGTESVDNLKISANFVNSAPTSLSLDNSSLDENISTGSRIAILTSSDPDLGDTFTYSLVPGYGSQDNEVFAIVGDELIINVSPDYEIQNSYSIRVRTTDQDGLSSDNTFFLTVNDVPEAPPAPIYIIETVIDGSDIGEDGSGSGVYGLYRIFGLEGRNSSILAVTDADLETDASVDSSSLTTAALPLLTAAGALFPSTNTPIAIRKDGSNLELLYKPSITSTTYQTQDFSLSTGKAIGAPAPLSSSLQSFEIPYDQDLDGDGITGPALAITETIDAADTGAGGDGAGTYGLYRISGISGKSASQLALSQADLEEGSTIAQSEVDPLLPLLTTRGTPLPAAWQPRAIRKDDIDGRIELLYRPTKTATSYQTQDFSLTTGRAIGAPTPLNKSLQSFEVAYDEDLDLDGIIGLSLSVQEVVDAADQGPGGDGSATYGLYSISGINGSSAAALAVADADLEDGLLVPQSELSTLVPLLTSAGKSLPTAWQPLAIRQDAANIELLYKPTKTAATYQTQDFSLTTGKAIGKPTPPLSSLLTLEVPYDQDFNEDGVLGINITSIGETTAVAGTAAKDRLTLTSMDIGYGGGADDTLLVGAEFSSNDPITMLGGPGNDTYTAKAGAFLVIYDLGTTKDTKDLLTGLPGTLKQWSLYRVETNDFLLQHTDNSTAVLLVDPLGKASAGNKLETIRFSTGAAQTMATLTNARTGILATEPAISYADLPDRFGYDIAFAYGISQEAGPLSLKTELSSNLAMVV